MTDKQGRRDIGDDDVKLDVWMKAVKEIGFPIVVSGVLLYGAYLLLVRAADLTTKLVESHARFLDVQMDQTKQQTDNSGKILDSLKGIERATEASAISNEDQSGKLGQLIDSSRETVDRLDKALSNQEKMMGEHDEMLDELKKKG